jgi:DNA (cytosine-5)-methyltransferase 1
MNIKFIDLFAGIGGFRIALEKAGATCVFSSEINKYALQVYQANFNEDASGDITQIKEEDIPAHDVLCAGFPCQAFSEFGQRKGFSDPRGTLFFEILRVAKHHKPKVVLLENVLGLTYHNGGDTFETIKNSLDALGYKVYWQVLDTSMFGLPQKRKRVFIVGVRKDIKKTFKFPEGVLTTRGMKDVMESNVDANHFIAEARWEHVLKQKKAGQCKLSHFVIGPDELAHTLLTSKYEHNLVVDTSKPTGTFHNVKAKTAKSARRNKQHVRRLTPREYGRLQGFPDSFQVPVSNKQAYRLFGNAVAPPVVEAVFAEIKRLIEK